MCACDEMSQRCGRHEDFLNKFLSNILKAHSQLEWKMLNLMFACPTSAFYMGDDSFFSVFIQENTYIRALGKNWTT